jgi:anti-sigma factor RsiW
MNTCEDIRTQIAFYLDEELHGSDRAAFTAHIGTCAECRKLTEIEGRFLESVRSYRPLYSATPEVRSRVEEILSSEPRQYTAPPMLVRKVRQTLGEVHSEYGDSKRRAVAIAAGLIAMLAVVGILVSRKTEVSAHRPSEFARMAAAAHERHIRSQLPLEITSDVPDEVSTWFKGKLPFDLRLPTYQELSGQEKVYQLEGARLVAYRNDYAAFVAYRMKNRPISLVVTSEKVAAPYGGEEIVSRGLTFHYDSIDGLKVITWVHNGLTYGLVSDLEERGQRSCVVCHEGTKDRDFIEGLRPKG